MKTLSDHEFILIIMKINQENGTPEKNYFDAICSYFYTSKNTVASLLSDLQRAELIVYSKDESDYYLLTNKGEIKENELQRTPGVCFNDY